MDDTVYIGANVVVGKDCTLGKHVVIHDDVVLGDGVKVGDFTVLGKRPMKAKRSAITTDEDLPPLRVGSNVMIGTGAIVYRGAEIEDQVLLADSCQVRERSRIGLETIIGRSVTVENQCRVGSRCKIETNAYITAYSTIEDDCFVAPMVTFTNDRFLGRTKKRFGSFKGAHLKRGSRVGANATLLPGITLGEDSLVAAGAIVTKDVAPKVLVMGCPAREIRPVDAEQLLENQ